METKHLLPNKYKPLGWFLFLTGMVLGIYFFNDGPDPIKVKVISLFFSGSVVELDPDKRFFRIIETGIGTELILLAIILGGFIIGFSREKVEDEFTQKLRSDSFVWAFIVNYVLLALMVIFIHGFAFVNMLVFNMLTPLLFFIIRFNFLKFRSRPDEE